MKGRLKMRRVLVMLFSVIAMVFAAAPAAQASHVVVAKDSWDKSDRDRGGYDASARIAWWNGTVTSPNVTATFTAYGERLYAGNVTRKYAIASIRGGGISRTYNIPPRTCIRWGAPKSSDWKLWCAWKGNVNIADGSDVRIKIWVQTPHGWKTASAYGRA